MPTEGTYSFSKADRKRIKSRAMLPTETLRYIEALEAVAQTAVEVWKNTPHASKPTALTVECLSELYDRLAAINFLDEAL